MYYSTEYQSPLGVFTLAADGENLVGGWFEEQKYYGASILATAVKDDEIPVFEQTKAWLDRYFAGQKPAISELPLAPVGTDFRQAVWQILCEIPYGQLTTYGEIAKKMAIKLNRETMSGQAVGGAVGHNPISIIIPCHRVVGSRGSLTGYAGGIDLKIKLLELEGVDVSALTVPKAK
ncbi:MAG: methylated-DNA--[protein]-cysteine S-methyltransferase [Clostridiaceae bacterium]|nr:methylated-DNA--[protein]-cysteine S-methyltransferase [Clostridiaceae bacterium]